MDKVKSTLEVTRNPVEIAKNLDVTLGYARRLLEDPSLPYLPGWGRVHMQKYIVSRKRRYAEWPSEDLRTLYSHRIQHDAGKTIMCQGYDGDWVIQYSIPTKRSRHVEPYFSRKELY